MYCKFEIALSLTVIYVVCVKKKNFFFTCYLLKFFNFYFYFMFDICPFCCFFFLNYLIGRGLIIMPIYLTTFHGIEKKKLLFSGGSVRKKGVVWLNREDLFQEQAYVWCNVKSRHHVRPCQDLRWFRETRWQFPKQSSVTSLGNVSITRGPAKRSSAYRWVFYRLEIDSLLRKTTVDRLDMSR